MINIMDFIICGAFLTDKAPTKMKRRPEEWQGKLNSDKIRISLRQQRRKRKNT
jgi:hypothetical protein